MAFAAQNYRFERVSVWVHLQHNTTSRSGADSPVDILVAITLVGKIWNDRWWGRMAVEVGLKIEYLGRRWELGYYPT